ncbi:alpha-amylase family glycosyl hydrolase [Luteimonas sp. SX5]|uniref:Alpha-amylase n=1 Tax=Luteimonas galliterrae TaxID=2940486 RepID=A0ABT0MDT5_9GAMM|nr:alpha-amylase family glycosyl hydrolase [Luteimonas galliterrae]MCL1633036.1 alpha-amylase family glycosyl hydrolase [Luteimonas galliterrae]
MTAKRSALRPAVVWLSAGLAGLALGCAGAAAAQASAEAGRLHVPSPDWRDQVVYFLMTDRFDDGEPRNNDQGAGEYDPADNAKYNGGDLRGVRRRLDYIRGLGATAVWITPPVANQWWNQRVRHGGYHGYWAEDFKRVDAHLGTLEDYRELSRSLHAAGMYLVQDVVVNHVGDYFAYQGGWSADDPARHFVRYDWARDKPAPTQAPFDANDARKAADRASAAYHWTPDIVDFNDIRQERTFQLAGLDDLNTENPAVREALRDSYGYWIREAGVDGFRVDTAFHVPPEFFADFMHSGDTQAPGMQRVAERTGRSGFHAFGEGFGPDRPYQDEKARKIETYARAADGQPLLTGMINFPLYATLGDVFARGHPSDELAYRIASMMRVHRDPWRMPTFVDNHDVDRFLAGGSEAGLKQALLSILTLPGIPTIYYGTEQGFTGQRAAMFARGYGSDGRDRFDASAPLYRFLQRAIALRREHRVFSRGTPTVLAANAAAPGAIAWRMAQGGESALVVLNSADGETLLDNVDTGLDAGTVLRGLFDIDGGKPDDIVVGVDGRIHLRLSPRSGQVWKVGGPKSPPTPSPATIALAPAATDRYADDFVVRGTAKGVPAFRLVVDGDLAKAATVRPDVEGRWQARVDTAGMIDASVEHRLVAWSRSPLAVSAARTFRIERRWQVLAEAQDPQGDDHGPLGRYRYPADPGWSDNRQADIRGVRVSSAGGALKIELTMRKLTTLWNPVNGFDHVAFTIFLQLPGRKGGSTLMPLQNATLPDGMRWHYRLRAGGWSNAMFAATNATADSEGAPVAPGARIETDPVGNRISFILPGSALGDPSSLSGARLYVATWDYDAGYRSLTPQPQSAGFGGGDGARDPLVMDDVAITLP